MNKYDDVCVYRQSRVEEAGGVGSYFGPYEHPGG